MSSYTTIQTGDAPVIFIDNVGGDLRVKGHNRNEIVVQSDDDHPVRFTHEQGEREPQEHDSVHSDSEGDASTEQAAEDDDAPSGEHIHLGNFSGDCRIELPASARLHVGPVGGDANIKAVHGGFVGSHVGGDLKLRRVGSTVLEVVSGDCSAKKVASDIHINHIGGDASIMDAGGALHLGAVGGDLVLSNLGGDIHASAGGDATLRLSLSAEQEVDVKAGGDLACYLPPETSADVELRSGSRTVTLRGWDVPPPDSDSVYEFTLGDGAASLRLSAGGDLALYAQKPGERTEPFSAEFRAGVESDFEFDFNEPRFEFDFESNFGEQFGGLSQELSARVQEKVQRAMQRAEAQIAAAMQRAEERIARAEERAARADERVHRRHQRRHARRTHTHITPPTPPVPPRPSRAPQQERTVSDEERMTVLRMVEEGKISVEQAEQLLTALTK